MGRQSGGMSGCGGVGVAGRKCSGGSHQRSSCKRASHLCEGRRTCFIGTGWMRAAPSSVSPQVTLSEDSFVIHASIPLRLSEESSIATPSSPHLLTDSGEGDQIRADHISYPPHLYEDL